MDSAIPLKRLLKAAQYIMMMENVRRVYRILQPP